MQHEYSLGIGSKKPDEEIVSVEYEISFFFVDVDELWYFQNYYLVEGSFEKTKEI